MVPVQITVPAQPGQTAAKSITVQVPAHALQGIRKLVNPDKYI